MRKRLRASASLLSLGLRVDRRLTVSLIVMTVLTNLAMTLRALWFALAVDAVVDGRLDDATLWAAVLALSDTTRSWALVGLHLDRQDLQERASQFLTEESMHLTGSLPDIAHHESPEHIDRLGAYRDAFPSLSVGLGTVVDAAGSLVRAAVTLGLLFTVHPLFLALPLFALPSLGAARRAEHIRLTANLETITLNQQADHIYSLMVDPASAKEVKVLGIGADLVVRHDDLWRRISTIQRRAQRRAATATFGGWLVFAVGFAGAVSLVVAGVGRGDVAAGGVVLGVVLAGQVNAQVAMGAATVAELTRAASAAGHRRWLVTYAEDHRASAGSTVPPRRLEHGIELRSVRFRYPATEVDVLRGIDLHLPAGSVVAIVGENGTGKSTLVKLLAGLYRPTSGAIAVDGIDLADIGLERWHERVTAGFQDFVRFQFQAADVVGVGHLPDREDLDRVGRAIDSASSNDVLAALPDGLRTQLGTIFGGIELSGGEWQKLALARTMMRPEPLLLLLDEPTAALDPPSEHELFGRYSAAAREAGRDAGAITVLVSHRFSTVRDADIIVVMDGGRVTETGTHEELVTLGGIYAELYGIQAMAYSSD